ncbi:hypothetical protein ACVXG9_06315 [Escherichia coli]
MTLKNTSAVAHQGSGIVLESSINGQEATVDIYLVAHYGQQMKSSTIK